MAATGTLGSKLYVATDPLVDIYASADNVSDFQMLTITNEVGLVENLGQFSRVFTLVTFNSIGDGRTLKLKGPFNDGNMALAVGMDLSDPGQAILFAAAKSTTQDTFPFKLTLNGANAYFDTVYFGALVMSYQIVGGTASNVLMANVSLEVNTEVFVSDS